MCARLGWLPTLQTSAQCVPRVFTHRRCLRTPNAPLFLWPSCRATWVGTLLSASATASAPLSTTASTISTLARRDDCSFTAPPDLGVGDDAFRSRDATAACATQSITEPPASGSEPAPRLELCAPDADVSPPTLSPPPPMPPPPCMLPLPAPSKLATDGSRDTCLLGYWNAIASPLPNSCCSGARLRGAAGDGSCMRKVLDLTPIDGRRGRGPGLALAGRTDGGCLVGGDGWGGDGKSGEAGGLAAAAAAAAATASALSLAAASARAAALAASLAFKVASRRSGESSGGQVGSSRWSQHRPVAADACISHHRCWPRRHTDTAS